MRSAGGPRSPGLPRSPLSSRGQLAVSQLEGGIVIAEAPLCPERSEAVITWVEEQFPEKPITHIISSHHHRDHSSGLRTYAARGVSVVMNELGAELFHEIFARPSTILPDALWERLIEPVIELVPVDGMFEIPDPDRPVMVVSIAQTHAAYTVFVYVGGGEVVFVGDGGAQTPEL